MMLLVSVLLTRGSPGCTEGLLVGDFCVLVMSNVGTEELADWL